jgi:hypothetical protein
MIHTLVETDGCSILGLSFEFVAILAQVVSASVPLVRMAPKGKRTSGAAESTPNEKRPRAQPKSGKKVKHEESALATKLFAKLENAGGEIQSFVQKVLDHYDATVEKHASIVNHLMIKYGDTESRLQFAAKLEGAFPQMEDLEYATDFDSGKKILTLWMCGWHPLLGNKGFLQKIETRILLQLIMMDAYNTDADIIAGAEKIIIAKVCPAFFKNEEYDTPKLSTRHKGILGVGAAAYIKGWTRSCTIVWLADALLELGLLHDMIDQNQKLWLSMRAIHALVSDKFATEESQINGHTELTMQNLMTRTRPNAFNHLFQIRKMERLGSNAETTMTKWQQSRQIMAAFAMGSSEAKAALNLAQHMYFEFVNLLQDMVIKWGFLRGPITHEALASKWVCLNEGPKLPASAYWRHNARTDNYASELMGKRIRVQYEEAPDGHRKTCNESDIEKLQGLCAAMSFAYRVVKVLCTQSMVEKEWPSIEEQFLMKYLDADLEDEMTKLIEPWQCRGVKVIHNLVQKCEEDELQQRESRDEELNNSLRAVSFLQVQEHLAHDQDMADRWLAEARGRASDELGQQRLHIQNRYTTGTARVKEFMDLKLNTIFAPGLGQAASEWFLMKSKLAKDVETGKVLETCPIQSSRT